MSKRFTSTNLKAKAIIDSIPKSLTVNENSIVNYQQSPRLFPKLKVCNRDGVQSFFFTFTVRSVYLKLVKFDFI